MIGLDELFYLYAVINLIVFVMYGVDKFKAVKDMWRIPEKTLLLSAVFGAPGALLGMIVFRHKIRKPKFYIGVPLILIIEIIILVALIKKAAG